MVKKRGYVLFEHQRKEFPIPVYVWDWILAKEIQYNALALSVLQTDSQRRILSVRRFGLLIGKLLVVK